MNTKMDEHERSQRLPRFLTEKQTEREYGLSGSWLRKMRWLRKGPAYVRAGKKILYPRESLEQFLSENTVRAQEGR